MVYREAVDDVSTSRMKKHRTVYEIRKVPDVPLQLGSLPVPKQWMNEGFYIITNISKQNKTENITKNLKSQKN